MDKRLFPITPEFFAKQIEPLILDRYIWKGRPPKISHYYLFCGVFYVLRTGVAWRDLPACYGPWHTIYTRFKRWSSNGLWWQVLLHLQQKKLISINVTMLDSTTIQVHRHGSGGRQVVAEIAQD